MRILIVAVGTRGDVAPYTGLAARFINASHEVTIAAYAEFEGMVRRCGAGFHPIPGDPRAEASWTHLQDGNAIGTGPLGLAARLRAMGDEMVRLAEAIRVAATGTTDVLLLSAPASLGYHVAEHLGIPCLGLALQPMFPTAAHPPSLLGFGRSLGPLGNRAAGHLVMGTMNRIFARAIRTVRADLDLPTLTPGQVARQMRGWTVQHGYSPTVLPRPTDWRPELDVAGYLWPWVDPQWRPSDELTAFLDDGPPPVFVGFGSCVFDDGPGLSATIADGLRKAGVRGVVQAGWTGLQGDNDRILGIGEAPHEWLFPQMAAVVHHAGAGTTAAGLRAGVPSIATPVVSDEPFWGSRMAQLGVGPKPIPHRKLTADLLADAVSAAVHNSHHRERAAWVASRIAGEDGAGHIVTAVEKLVG
jgi:UDP:flavonoid glycosyltransferase YjiC (YdhE family)